MSPVRWISRSSSRLGADVLFRRCGAQRVVQVAEPLEHPCFAAAILHVAKAGEERVAGRDIGGERRPDEFELRLAIGILDPCRLRLEDLAPVRHLAQRELQRERDEVGLGERQPGHRLGHFPDPFEPADRVARERDVAQRVEPGGFRALRSRRRRARASACARAPALHAGDRRRSGISRTAAACSRACAGRTARRARAEARP